MKKRSWVLIGMSILILLSMTGIPQVSAADINFCADVTDGGLEGWTPNGGSWTNPGGYARVVCAGDAWNIYDATASDFTYSGDLTLENGNAVGLSFRTNNYGTQGYDVIIDRIDGRLKLCKRPYLVLGSYNCKINANQTYHVTIVATGANIRVSLDGTERISLDDRTYASGKFGMFGYGSSARIDNLSIAATANQSNAAAEQTAAITRRDASIFNDDFNDGVLEGWTPNGGAWTNPGGYARVVCAGDAWNIYGATGSDFTFSGDLTLESGNAVGLSFRTNNNGTQGYDIILDRVDGRLKLCKRPYLVLGSYNCSVNFNQVYPVQVIARGSRIRVFLDGVERINLNDGTYPSGKFGMFAYAATARVDNLMTGE